MEFDQSEKSQLVTWLMWLVEFQHGSNFKLNFVYRIGSLYLDLDVTDGTILSHLFSFRFSLELEQIHQGIFRSKLFHEWMKIQNESLSEIWMRTQMNENVGMFFSCRDWICRWWRDKAKERKNFLGNKPRFIFAASRFYGPLLAWIAELKLGHNFRQISSWDCCIWLILR